jgi:hypothetical protein
MKNPKAYAEGLRELAQFVEEKLTDEDIYASGVEINFYYDSFDEMGSAVTALGGRWDKHEAGHWFILSRKFGPHHVYLNVNRDEVCTKVQTGTRTVEVPDPEFVAKAPLVTIEEPVYGWKCPDSVLGQ